MVNLKRIIHKSCGLAHVDRGFFKDTDHTKHYCEHCSKYFYDAEKGVGVEVEANGVGRL